MLLMLAFPGAQSIPIHAGPSLAVIGFAFGLVAADGHSVRRGAGVDCGAGEARGCVAQRHADHGDGNFAAAADAGGAAGRVSLVLLVGAGLFSQSLNKLQSTDLKLDARNRYIVHINPQAAGYTQPQLEALYRTMEERFHALPGVVKVGISTYTPMEDNNCELRASRCRDSLS